MSVSIPHARFLSVGVASPRYPVPSSYRWRRNIATATHRGLQGAYPCCHVHTSRKKERSNSRRSEEHTSELQSLMRNSYAVLCLKKKTTSITHTYRNRTILHL